MSARGVGSRSSRAASIRHELGHPVVDADGHWIETAPVLKAFFLDFVKDLGGADLAARFEAAGGLDYDDTVLRPWSALSEADRRKTWATRPPWWTLPAANTLDRATAHLPRLLYERLDDFGIDFAVLYPSRTLTTPAIREAELRQIACRALNVYHHELYGGYTDRMTPVALVPTHTPEEAIAELEHAVGELGMKAIMINGLVHRPIGASAAGSGGAASPGRDVPNWGSGSGERIDALGLDSEYDYDPFWRRCVELRVAPASHTPGMGWGSRRSVSSYVSNHIGSFGASMEAFCRSIFLGGVTRRFPELSFGLLEGGVGWACELYAGLVSHWEKRSAEAIHHLDPARIDTDELLDLFTRYGDERMQRDGAAIAESFRRLEPEPPELDEYKACAIEKKQDLHDLFVPRFYFGCEADDGTVAFAFDERVNPMGARLRAMFSSDMGHWDVPDMTGILEEAYELVEKGLLDEAAFREFVCVNPVRFYTSVNPDFFAGTRVEAEAKRIVAEESA
ncbi:MAG: amidohydrolase family protein [Spirochaetaceae bacterium]|nr:amidohydrolase family protein [Spirochaetaceae bacterium]HPG24237.1 amidohydrolase family protein [Myxococcota bacterium]